MLVAGIFFGIFKRYYKLRCTPNLALPLNEQWNRLVSAFPGLYYSCMMFIQLSTFALVLFWLFLPVCTKVLLLIKSGANFSK